MAHTTLRQNIAAEAARLLVQRQAQDWYSARKKAARHYSRKRVNPTELPTHGEIQEQVLSLAGVYKQERGWSLLLDLRMAAADLMGHLRGIDSRVRGNVLLDRVEAGAEIELIVCAQEVGEVLTALRALDVRYLSWDEAKDDQGESRGQVRGLWRYPFTLEIHSPTAQIWSEAEGLELESLAQLIKEVEPTSQETRNPACDEGGYHPELKEHLRVWLQQLEAVRLDPRKHPEGDLLYHSLQVFELGREKQPYDEEFLLACLLHDVGYGLDRRHPQRALMQGIGNLLTDRTRFLLEHHPEGIEYLSSGKIKPSLRKSSDFDDLILLAKCDLGGRVCGAEVSTIEEVLDYIFGLEETWENLTSKRKDPASSEGGEAF